MLQTACMETDDENFTFNTLGLAALRVLGNLSVKTDNQDAERRDERSAQCEQDGLEKSRNLTGNNLRVVFLGPRTTQAGQSAAGWLRSGELNF